MIGAYRDDCGFVGEADPLEDATAASDEACREALNAAEALAAILDRRDGDAGEHADALLSLRDRIVALHDEATALLGAKCRVVRDRHGRELGVVYADRMRDPCRAGLWDIVPDRRCPVCNAAPDTACGRIA